MAKKDKATGTKEPPKTNPTMDRIFNPLYENVPFMRPKGWVPLDEREEEEEQRPSSNGSQASAPRIRTAGADSTGPREVDVQHGSIGRRVTIGAIWLLAAVIAIVGIKSLVAGNPAPKVTVIPSAKAAWPDQQADAFAARFATAYLTAQPRGHEQAVQPFLTGALKQTLSNPGASPINPFQVKAGQTVTQAVATGAQTIDANHAMIDVAVTTMQARGQGQYLTYSIPVYHAPNGGLAVYALPGIVPSAPAAPGGSGGLGLQPLNDSGAQTAIRQFMQAWLTNNQSQMSYLSAPKASFLPMPTGLRLKKISSMQIVCPGSNSSCILSDLPNPTIQATFQLVNSSTGATLMADYFFTLAKNQSQNWVIQSATTGN